MCRLETPVSQRAQRACPLKSPCHWKFKAKIAYHILQNPKQEGGLNLVNLKNRDIALKATWPQILHEEREYAALVYNLMKCTSLGEDIWRCTLIKEDIKVRHFGSQFWNDVLSSWNEFNFYSGKRIENQLIWYNSHIRVGGKPVFWADVYEKGLKYVYQLFELCSFVEDQKVFEQYGLTKLRFNSLKVAIPSEWKSYFCQNSRAQYFPIPPHNYDMWMNRKGLSRAVYTFLAGDIFEVNNKFLSWTKEMGQDLCTDLISFGKAHMDIYKTTNIPKFRSFQYRVLQRALVTNIHLQKWSMSTTDLCSFCGIYRETISHLLCDCPKILPLWEEVKEYMLQRYDQEVVITTKGVLLNQLVPKAADVINFICLLTKQFIYRQRCMKGDISFSILKGSLKQTENLEKYIATKNDKIGIHNKKWNRLDNVSSVEVPDNLSNYIEEHLHNVNE